MPPTGEARQGLALCLPGSGGDGTCCLAELESTGFLPVNGPESLETRDSFILHFCTISKQEIKTVISEFF